MTPLKFLNSLPLARLVVDSDQRSRDSLAQDVLGGNYRLLNEASKKCLSYTARSPLSSSLSITGPQLTG